MPEHAEIRLFTLADESEWLPLWQAYQRFYHTEISAKTSQYNWQRLCAADTALNGALAIVNGRAAGFVHYIYHPSTWTTGDYCYLQDLYVDPQFRGQAIGRALIEHVYQAAEHAGCARVYWLTHHSNKEAMLLYDKVADPSGFIQYRKILAQ